MKAHRLIQMRINLLMQHNIVAGYIVWDWTVEDDEMPIFDNVFHFDRNNIFSHEHLLGAQKE